MRIHFLPCSEKTFALLCLLSMIICDFQKLLQILVCCVRHAVHDEGILLVGGELATNNYGEDSGTFADKDDMKLCFFVHRVTVVTAAEHRVRMLAFTT